MKNNQNLFFFPEEKGRAFSDVLKEVQEYISSKYSTLMVDCLLYTSDAADE